MTGRRIGVLDQCTQLAPRLALTAGSVPSVNVHAYTRSQTRMYMYIYTYINRNVSKYAYVYR